MSLEAGGSDDDDEAENEDVIEGNVVATPIEFPFQKVDLTFRDIRYTVTASVGSEKLELLKGVSGIIEAGKMTALVSVYFFVCSPKFFLDLKS